MDAGERSLSAASRIYFAIHHPIQYNVKVKSIGYVHPDHLPMLLAYWNMENEEKSDFTPFVASTPSVQTGGSGQSTVSDILQR
jgi:hypothetical protein